MDYVSLNYVDAKYNSVGKVLPRHRAPHPASAKDRPTE